MKLRNEIAVLTFLLLPTVLILSHTNASPSPTPENAGPYIDELNYQLIMSPDAQLTALRTHWVDQAYVPRPQDLPVLRAAGFTITTTFCPWPWACATAQGWIGLVNHLGIGVMNNFWSPLRMRSCEHKTVLKRIMTTPMTTLNPTTACTAADWQILEPVVGCTFVEHPYTLEYVWLGHEARPVQQLWAGPDGIWGTNDDGMKTTVNLKDYLYWDDGHPVTAEDWWFTMEMLHHQNNEKYREYHQYYYQTEIMDPYTFIEYAIVQDMYRFESLDIGFLCPRHIWEPFIQPTYDGPIPPTGIYPHMIDSVNHHSEWRGWEEPYPGSMGGSQLVGMGPFYYPIGAWQATSCYIKANHDWWGGRICPGDVDLNGIVDLLDLSLVLDAQGTYPGHPVWEGPDATGTIEMLGPATDIACPSQIILGAEISTIIGHFGHTWGPGVPPCVP